MPILVSVSVLILWYCLVLISHLILNKTTNYSRGKHQTSWCPYIYLVYTAWPVLWSLKQTILGITASML